MQSIFIYQPIYSCIYYDNLSNKNMRKLSHDVIVTLKNIAINSEETDEKTFYV